MIIINLNIFLLYEPGIADIRYLKLYLNCPHELKSPGAVNREKHGS